MENNYFWPDEFPAITFCLKDLNKPEWEELGSPENFLNEPTAFNEIQIWSPIRETTSSGADENKIEVKDTPLCIEDVKRDQIKSLPINDAKYQCNLFMSRYKHKKHLFRHLRTEHKEKPYECYICREKFINKKYLRKHFEKFHLRFKCKNCGKSYKKKKYLIQHTKRFQGNCKRFTCSDCLEKFRNQNALTAHKGKVHKIKAFQCDICGRSFPRKQTLSRHKKSSRCRIQTFPCPNCDARYMNEQSLVRHMKKKHAGDRDDCLDEPRAKVDRIVTPNANDVVLKMEEISLGNVQIDTEMLPTEARNTSG